MSNATGAADDEKISEITREIIDQILLEYPRIQSLDFSNNLLTGIQYLEPTGQTLLALNLSNNMISFGPTSVNCLGSLINLVVLNLSNNRITTLH